MCYIYLVSDQPEGGARPDFPQGILRLATYGWLSGLPQAAGELPGGWLLGSCQKKVGRGSANAAQRETARLSGSNQRVLLHQAISAGAVSHGPDTGITICQAAGTGETGPGRFVGMGK